VRSTSRRKVGASWVGDKYVHGPRLVEPKKFVKFRLGKPTKEGIRLVFGKTKRGKWKVQSRLTPKGRSSGNQ
jgi:hypothetical protein